MPAPAGWTEEQVWAADPSPASGPAPRGAGSAPARPGAKSRTSKGQPILPVSLHDGALPASFGNSQLRGPVVHQKSIRPGVGGRRFREVHATTTTVGRLHRHPPGIRNARQRQREEKSGRQTKNCPRSASTLPVPKCTGDADRRFSLLPGVRELHWAEIRSGERPASPYSVRYEFCRRDNSEHIRG